MIMKNMKITGHGTHMTRRFGDRGDSGKNQWGPHKYLKLKAGDRGDRGDSIFTIFINKFQQTHG